MTCGCGSTETTTTDCTDSSCISSSLSLIPIGPCSCACQGATPRPYYTNADACEESHRQIIIQNQFSTGITTASAFIMPACNSTAVIIVHGLQVIPIGSYLWNPTYGYLLVTEFDAVNEALIVKNECQNDNAAPGTIIPACTVFTVTDVPCCGFNPCTAQAVSEGSLVVCDGATQTTLAPSNAGQIPVSTGTGNEVQFQTLDIPVRSCTTLTSDLTLIVGNAGPYVLFLADTSIFSVGELIQIGTRTDRITVTHITSGVQLEGTVAPVPGGTVVIPDGTAVCHAPCCEQVQKNLNDFIAAPCTWNIAARAGVDADIYDSGLAAPGTLAILEIANGLPISQTIQNLLCTPMLLLIDVHYEGAIVADSAAAPADGQAYWMPSFGQTGGVIGTVPAPALAILQDYFVMATDLNAAFQAHSFAYDYHKNVIVPAGYEIKLIVNIVLQNLGSLDPTFALNYSALRSVLNVAMINI